MKLITVKILFLILICGSLSAQSRVNASVPIHISLVKGLSMNLLRSSLDFGEIIQNPAISKISKNAKDGILFEVAGNPGKNITINYSATQLTNSKWAHNFGSQQGNIDFIPSIMISSTTEMNNPLQISNGSVVNLSKENDGKLFVSIGGDINIASSQPAGDYLGNFSLTVTY